MGNQIKMKLFSLLLALFVIQQVFAAQGQPVAASYCMGNVDDSTNCSSCFNWGSGTIGARTYVANSTCGTAVTNAVASCKWYSGTNTSTISLQDCSMCDSKDWLNLTDHASTASSRVRACSDTAISTTTCSATISNCANPFASRLPVVLTLLVVPDVTQVT